MTTPTPCPPWCDTDHTQFTSHMRTIGVTGKITVDLTQYLQDAPVIVVTCDITRGASREAGPLELAPEQAPTFAALVDDLGHPRIGALVQRAADLIGGGQ
jgi:hypothetical protein